MRVLYPGMRDYVIRCMTEGVHITELYHEVTDKFNYTNDFVAFRGYVYRLRSRGFIPPKTKKIRRRPTPKVSDVHVHADLSNQMLDILKKEKYIAVINLCNRLNCPPKKIRSLIKDFRELGYEIVHDDLHVSLSSHDLASVPKYTVSKDREILFGVASDLHFGSRSCQITRLNEFCDLCRKMGIKHIFVPGDITAGFEVFKGQHHELYAHGAEAQEATVIRNLPEGFTWYFLGGNHDYSFVQKCSHNPLRSIEASREDCIYVGYDDASIEILNGVDLKMWHPRGATAYALSYKIQKRIERLGLDELNKLVMDAQASAVRILLAGHFHQNLSMLQGGILALQCGAFEGKNNLTERMGVTPVIGGWIIRAWFNGDNIVEYEQRFWTRPEIPEDWRNYQHTIEEPKKINGPVFPG